MKILIICACLLSFKAFATEKFEKVLGESIIVNEALCKDMKENPFVESYNRYATNKFNTTYINGVVEQVNERILKNCAPGNRFEAYAFVGEVCDFNCVELANAKKRKGYDIPLVIVKECQKMCQIYTDRSKAIEASLLSTIAKMDEKDKSTKSSGCDGSVDSSGREKIKPKEQQRSRPESTPNSKSI
jgi:hypothetical protein